MSAPARWRKQTVSETPHYRTAIHRAPSDLLKDARLQLVVDEAVESFQIAAGATDGTRSELIKFWTEVFARQAADPTGVAA